MDIGTDFAPSSLVADAQRKESLEDFGPGEYAGALEVLTADYPGAGLSELGAHIIRSGLVHSLRMRLRATEWRRLHPEIAEEQIEAPVVVVGMMRSGTTLMQRLLAADPRFTCAHGWEVLEAAPKLTWDPDGPDPRIDAALTRQDQTQQFMPDLFAIHPMYALEAEEEIVFLDQAFLSHVPESGAHLPTYRSWLNDQDFTPAYDHLHAMLQLLQWQKRQRGEAPGRWVLKTPAHLGYLDDLRSRFPDLHVVHLHRDPVASIGSGASLNATLHAMHSDHVDLVRVGAQWIERTGWTNDRALATRDRWDLEAPGLVTDIAFEDAVADPIGSVARVYAALGLDLDGTAEKAMRDWLARRPREEGRPDYQPETYGLSEGQIRERFRAYEQRFRG
ncbi:sulfotransferase family protein [Nocardioides marmorisolisilvae]|uniref:Sulfotransferase n=1 Tax=Nocardioides marmorisolisilvae TaxID=1542737 RepID=A0A3N0E0S5_9ACTN|nr:sulfotransferase [Nocardioides marmorisolisilvae]RNL81343.1 sulfotransferase [Nocardioides marmorisolisilvae]